MSSFPETIPSRAIHRLRLAAAAWDVRPFVSIVVPCLNEALVIGEFVDWCFEGLRRAGCEGEVLIVDSSTDESAAIAEAHGARVLRVPKRGLGQAYRDALPHIRGEYVIMGDADLTYDFREIAPFIKQLDAGHEFVMGSRTRGWIEPGAMPRLHRYFGTPATTRVLNTIYGTHHSDIHCGMRAMTIAALRRIDLQSAGWEYASEMVLKASLLGLRCVDVPIKFYKDREGRRSHHQRSGWLSPWRAGWINLRAMFVYAPDFFLFWPGVAMLTIGAMLVLALCQGPRRMLGTGFDLHWMLLGVTLCTLGYGGLHMGMLARVYYGFRPRFTRNVQRLFGYDQGMALGLVLMAGGLLTDAGLLGHWLRSGRRLTEISHAGVAGLLLIILGFQTITHTLILQMISLPRRAAAALPAEASVEQEASQ